MNKHWTFSDNDTQWVNDTFETKEEAIQTAKNALEDTFFVGQLQEESTLTFKMVNVEQIKN